MRAVRPLSAESSVRELPATSSRTIPTRGGSPSAARRRATLRPWPVSAAGPTRTLRAASTRARSVTRTRCRQPRPSMWAAYWDGSISERGMSWRAAATRPPSRWRPPRRPTTCWAASRPTPTARTAIRPIRSATARTGATFWPMPPCRTRRRPVRPAWAVSAAVRRSSRGIPTTARSRPGAAARARRSSRSAVSAA